MRTRQALTSPIVAVLSGAGVGVGATAIRVSIPAWREDPGRIHREAAPVAGGPGPHLCPAPEVVSTFRAVEFSHAPHLVTGHRIIALPAFPASGHLFPLGHAAPPDMVTGGAGKLPVHGRDEVFLGTLEHA